MAGMPLFGGTRPPYFMCKRVSLKPVGHCLPTSRRKRFLPGAELLFLCGHCYKRRLFSSPSQNPRYDRMFARANKYAPRWGGGGGPANPGQCELGWTHKPQGDVANSGAISKTGLEIEWCENQADCLFLSQIFAAPSSAEKERENVFLTGKK